MKRILLSLTLFLVFVSAHSQAIQVNTSTYSVPQLVQNVLFGDGTNATSCSGTISNITWSTGTNFGSTNGIGYFTNTNPAFPLANGVILSTGNVASAPGPNANIQSGGNDAWVGDAQLNNYLLNTIPPVALASDVYSNATRLEFDFVPVANNFSFDFLFASEEYGTFQCGYSDAFAFFLNNVTTGAPAVNIALIPGTTIPISVITIRNMANNGNCLSANPAFFDYYSPSGGTAAANASATNFNGTTMKLTAASNIIAGNTYHIKLVIADRGAGFADNTYDSAVFLGGGSFDIGATTIIPEAGSGFTNTNYLVADNSAICSGSSRNIQIGNAPNPNATYTWFQGTTQLQNGPSNVYNVTQPGIYSVTINYSATCTVPSTNNFVVEFFPPMTITNPNDLTAATNLFNLNANNNTILNGQSPFDYTIAYHTNIIDAQFAANIIPNSSAYPGTDGQTIYVSIINSTTECIETRSFLLNVLVPVDAGTDGDITVCDSNTNTINLIDLITGEDANGVWTRLTGTGGTFDPTNGTFTPALGSTTSQFQYYLTATPPANDDSSIATVNIVPQPNTGASGTITFCDSNVAVIDLFSIISGEQSGGVWTRTGGTGGLFDATMASFTPAAGATTSTFAYTLTTTSPCVDSVSQAEIIINPQPDAGTNGSLSICNDNLATIDLFGIITGEQAGGVWTRTSGAGGTFNAVVGTFTPTATSTSSTFNYTIAASAPCTPSQSTATITISNQPNAGTDGATTVCESSVEVIDLYTLISGEQLGGTWTRTSGAGGTFNAAAGNFTPGFGATASTFEYQLIGTAPCVDDVSVVTITFVTAPTINQPSDFIVCDDSLNNDGIFCFDLTTKDAEVTTDPTVVVTYHVTQSDALTGNNPLPNPFCNNQTGTQTIYVRVSDPIATQCPSTTSFQLIVNPLPLPNPIVTNYELCDYNNAGDGIEVFDLSTKTNEIANGQTNVIITYYDNEPDAIAQNNPLPNNYSNTTPNQQTIWFNIAFNTTNCSTTGSFDLIVNPLPNSLQPGYPNYELCDVNNPGDGIEEFDLSTKVEAILLGQTGMTVGFYPTLNDATQNTSEITNLLYPNQVAFQQTLGIRITNITTGCYVVSTMDLIVNSLPVLVQPTMPFVYCDEDQNGQTLIDLDTITPQIIGASNYTITYHLTLSDAQTGNNPLSSPFSNNQTFMQTLYVRAVDAAGNGCENIITIDLVVNPRPIIPVLAPLTNCDQDTNNQNGVTTFNLELQTPIILNAQTPPTTNYSVSYYLTQTAAQSQTAPIIQTTNFQGSNNQVIWYTVRNATTSCFEVGSFTLVVNTPIVLTYPTLYAICDNLAPTNDFFATFDLPSFVTNFSNPAIPAGYVYEFYTDPLYTAASLIATPEAFVNTTFANQTIFVKVINTATGCYSNRNITVRVLLLPTPKTDPPALAPQCDNVNPGDGYEVFDLTVNAAYIANNESNIILHYFPSELDAIANTNEILNPSAANVNGDVYIRVTYTVPQPIDFNGERCYVIVRQQLRVDPLPVVNQAITDYQICQDATATPGIAVFDLTSKIPEILGTTQNPADFTVSFYTTQTDAQSGTNAIANPSNYTNLTNPQTIYVRVVNNTTGCVNSTGVFQILVNPKPTATMPANSIDNCDTQVPNDGFFTVDLTTQDAEVLNGQDPTQFIVTYYTSQADSDAGLNPITPANDYSANTQTVYIRVTNNVTGCYETTTVDIITEQIPEPIITTIGGVNVLCVNFTDDSIERPLQLVAENGIVGNYTYQWFEGGTAIPGATNAIYNIPFDPLNLDRNYTVEMTSTSTLSCNVTSDVFTVIQSGQAVAIDGGYTITNAFADNQIITVTIDGYGAPDYQFSLDDGPLQTSPIFENVGLGSHIIYVWDIKGQPFACDPLELLNVQTIDYPYYFTPNGDGIHDTWNINGLINQPSAKIYIFDRYGKLIKQISPISPGWDGTYNGNMLPSTDYWFTVDFTEASGIKQFKAHFSLKR